VEADFERVADLLHEAVLLSLEVQKSCGKMLVDFVSALKGRADLVELKLKVRARAGRGVLREPRAAHHPCPRRPRMMKKYLRLD
jgi:glycine hydroxymethyltransferase